MTLSRTLALTALLTLITVTGASAQKPRADYPILLNAANLAYDSVNIQTQDHARLTGWLCKPAQDSSDLVVVMAGGDAGNMSYDVPLAAFVTQHFKIPVLLFDYRGFGSS